jgi:hypothetical protein
LKNSSLSDYQGSLPLCSGNERRIIADEDFDQAPRIVGKHSANEMIKAATPIVVIIPD